MRLELGNRQCSQHSPYGATICAHPQTRLEMMHIYVRPKELRDVEFMDVRRSGVVVRLEDLRRGEGRGIKARFGFPRPLDGMSLP